MSAPLSLGGIASAGCAVPVTPTLVAASAQNSFPSVKWPTLSPGVSASQYGCSRPKNVPESDEAAHLLIPSLQETTVLPLGPASQVSLVNPLDTNACTSMHSANSISSVLSP